MTTLFYVGAMLKEPLDVTLQFAAWYLDQGAKKILIFLDDPDDPAASILETLSERQPANVRVNELLVLVRWRTPRRLFEVEEGAGMDWIMVLCCVLKLTSSNGVK